MRLQALAVLASLILSGCVAAATQPMPVISYPLHEGEQQPNLLVLLRGLGADNAIFAEEGIIEAIRARRLPCDIVAPDSHYGYYKTGTLVARLKEDIIDPARRQGYEQIWLAGFSMGGMGGLFFLSSHPVDVDGLLLISPFLGWRLIHEEIRLAGGVKAWQPSVDDANDWEVMLWSLIRDYAKNSVDGPPIYLGYSTDDMLAADGPPLLATILPAERVFAVPGNHTVATFKKIFLRHLDTLARHAPPASGVSSLGRETPP